MMRLRFNQITDPTHGDRLEAEHDGVVYSIFAPDENPAWRIYMSNEHTRFGGHIDVASEGAAIAFAEETAERRRVQRRQYVTEPDEYSKRCERAATAQGLDPIVAGLRADGFTVDVLQTGGFCMVAAVFQKGEAYVGITDAREREHDVPSALVCFIDTQGNEHVAGEKIPYADLARVVRNTLDNACPVCGEHADDCPCVACEFCSGEGCKTCGYVGTVYRASAGST